MQRTALRAAADAERYVAMLNSASTKEERMI
jgi:phage tail tape-measure protein